MGSGGLHPVAEYNPVHNIVIFGGGDGNNQLYKIDVNEKITALAPSPAVVGCHPSSGILTVDPVSGHYLHMNGDGRFFQYDVVSDVWTELGTSLPFSNINNTIASPVSTYGVIMVVAFNWENSKIWLYKHAPSVRPNPPSSLSVQ
jgi:hypothetical protein